MKNKITVIYHRADFDGIFCCEIAKKFLPDAELIGWHYGDTLIPMPSEGIVYILDLSPECLAPTEGGESVPYWDRIIWIDHHKSAIEKYDTPVKESDLPPHHIAGYRIDGVAACRLAWQWFLKHNTLGIYKESFVRLPTKQEFIDRSTISEPKAVRLAGEYDIWDKRDPNAELFQHGLRSMELDEKWWDQLLHSVNSVPTVGILLTRGEAIQYAQTQLNKDIITSYGFDLEFEGLKFLACNHARYNSHLFTAGLKPEHDACFGFKWTGKFWEISLYHAPGKEHHDLSLIAVKHGGGGHRGACGFRMDKLPF